MKKVLDLIPKITLWVLMAWGILSTILFFAGDLFTGGPASELINGEVWEYQSQTNQFLATNYIYFVLIILVTCLFVLWGFVSLCMQDMKKALVTLGVVVGIILLFFLCWALGSADKIEIIGYEGADNEGFWARLSDMMLYVTYILFGSTLLTIACGWIYTKVKK